MTIRNTRLRAMTTSLAVLALVAGLAGPAAAAPSAPAAPGRPGAPTQPVKECDEDQSGTHPGVDCVIPGDPDDPDNPGGDGPGGGGGIDAEAECAAQFPNWADCVAVVNANGMHPGDICGYVVHPDQSQLRYYHPDAPDGYVLYYRICPRDGVFYTEDTQANPGGGGPPAPDPADVAEGVWARVQGDLEQPAVETWPPLDRSSVLHLPTFVSVTNWPAGGTVTERGCDGPVCIDLTATPTLTFDPGDESGIVACPPGGTRFDRDSPAPEPGQDVDGACAHVYDQRTGVARRPAAWPGEVTMTWNVHWEEDGGAEEQGDFDPFPLTTDLPRVVTELVSVITKFTPAGRG